MSKSKIGRYIFNAAMGLVAGRATGMLRNEFALARQEVGTKAKKVTAGVVILVAAGAVVLLSLPFFAVAAVIGLANVWPAWLAALVVGGGLLLIALLLLAIGLAKVKRNKNLRPDQAISNLATFFTRS